MPNCTTESGVCGSEAKVWRECVAAVFEQGSAPPAVQPMEATCAEQRAMFDKCVKPWRAEVGPNLRLRGPHPGEPPLQCAAMACTYESCMANAKYNHARCTGAMQQFKHCVKALHMSEWVLD
jgi:hypothetical protein